MEVIGRDAELRAVDAFLDAATGSLSVLTIRGEAGIGKTTLSREAIRRAGARGFVVLAAQPAVAETQLTLATLADLLEPVIDLVGGELSPLQRAAIDAALLRADPSVRPLEPRLLGVATRSLLEQLAARQPVLVAIDDVQWVDTASASTLAFALRRLASARIGLLLVQRTGEPSPLELGQGLEPDRTIAVDVGPLTLAALHHVLKARTGRAPTRATLIRIADASGGSPLFALEILRALHAVGLPPAGEPLPVPADIRALVRDRVRRLPDSTNEVLLLAATIGRGPTGIIEGAVGRPIEADLARAAREDIAGVEAGHVVFVHPLFAGAVLGEATAAERRRAHRRLAAVAAGDEERSRHLALGSPGPSAARAAELEAVAIRADGRGAPASAVELMELSIRLTPPGDRGERASRGLALAQYAYRAGDAGGAQEILEQIIDGVDDRRLRARAELALSAIRYESDAATSAVELASAALADAQGDPELQARAHATLAAVDWEDFSRHDSHVTEALRLLDLVADPDPLVLQLALMERCGEDVAAGRPLDAAIVERALELERRAPPASVSDRFSASLGVWLKYLDDLDGARHWLERTYQAALDEGDEGSLPYAISHLPELELWTGNWEAAEALALRHLELATERELESQRRQALYNLALVHVHQGRVENARDEIDEALAAAASDGDPWTTASVLPLLGLLELQLGQPAQATGHLLEASALRERLGQASPRRHDQDLVESLLAIGDPDRAREVLAGMEDRAARFGRHSACATAARARALVAATTGDLDGAAGALEEALAEHELAPILVDRARTLLVQGQVRRRRRQRTAAKLSFEAALGTFERLGAELWAQRTREELARTGLRRAAGPGLTENERRVAELAATGMTNREVAAFAVPESEDGRVEPVAGVREAGRRIARRAGGPPGPRRAAGITVLTPGRGTTAAVMPLQR